MRHIYAILIILVSYEVTMAGHKQKMDHFHKRNSGVLKNSSLSDKLSRHRKSVVEKFQVSQNVRILGLSLMFVALVSVSVVFVAGIGFCWNFFSSSKTRREDDVETALLEKMPRKQSRRKQPYVSRSAAKVSSYNYEDKVWTKSKAERTKKDGWHDVPSITFLTKHPGYTQDSDSSLAEERVAIKTTNDRKPFTLSNIPIPPPEPTKEQNASYRIPTRPPPANKRTHSVFDFSPPHEGIIKTTEPSWMKSKDGLFAHQQDLNTVCTFQSHADFNPMRKNHSKNNLKPNASEAIHKKIGLLKNEAYL